MRKYVYENATVYITKPTEEQIKNIHKATERFAKKLVKKGVFQNGRTRLDDRRINNIGSKAKKRNRKIKS